MKKDIINYIQNQMIFSVVSIVVKFNTSIDDANKVISELISKGKIKEIDTYCGQYAKVSDIIS